MSRKIKVISTVAPYVRHREFIAQNVVVDELRLNTIQPIAEEPIEVLAELKKTCAGKRLWIDLKTRQLRIVKFAYIPFAFVELSHKIKVDLPTEIFFKGFSTRVVRIVDGNRLILEDRPEEIVGDGQPVNILDPSLEVEGFLTDKDIAYIEAAKKLGLHCYMLSFTEKGSDIEAVLKLDPRAQIVAKIESMRGLEFVRGNYRKFRKKGVHLMAARDDLFVNMGMNSEKIIGVLEEILDADPQAIVASRILTSLEEQSEVSMGDISDLELMLRMGYKNVMLSDGLCFCENSCRAALAFLGRFLEDRR